MLIVFTLTLITWHNFRIFSPRTYKCQSQKKNSYSNLTQKTETPWIRNFSNSKFMSPATIFFWNDSYIIFVCIRNVYLFFFLFSGNLLTVVALLRCQKLRSHATTMFVISLAVSDLLFCSINLPLTASRYVHEEWRLGSEMCR